MGVVLLLCLSAHVVYAQEIKRSHITGAIMDSYGSLIDDVQVTFTSSDGHIIKVNSKTDGEYSADVKPGIYSVRFTRPPFKDFFIEEFQIPLTPKMQLDISLICSGCKRIDDK
jgi:hypothetical protein